MKSQFCRSIIISAKWTLEDIMFLLLLISGRRLGVYYFLSLTLSVCPSVAPSVTANFKSILLFCLSMESNHFWPPSLHVAFCKTLFFDFWFRPLTPKIYSPKFGTKSPITRRVWQIDRRCLGLLGSFWGWLIQWKHTKCRGADPCCHGNEISGNYYVKFGHFSGKNRVKFENFVNFSGKYHTNSGILIIFSGKNHLKFGHLVNFSYIFVGQKCCAP